MLKDFLCAQQSTSLIGSERDREREREREREKERRRDMQGRSRQVFEMWQDILYPLRIKFPRVRLSALNLTFREREREKDRERE